MRKFAYCSTCDKDVEYKTFPKAEICRENGMTFSYRKIMCKCKECNTPVFIQEVCIENERAYKQAYDIANKKE